MERLLNVGDVILIDKGMKISTKIPKKFIFENTRFSDELDECEIVVGKTYTNECDESDITEKITDDIIRAFKFRTGINANKNDVKSFVRLIIKYNTDALDTSDYIGEYIVIESKLTGGGYVRPNDYVPDEPFVICKQLVNGEYDNNSKAISFYVSRNRVKPIRKMKMTFK